MTLVKSTSTYFKHFTHHPNWKLSTIIFHELVEFLSLTEKMLTAFFNISWSVYLCCDEFIAPVNLYIWIMANSYENEFKVMIVELLNSGRKVKEISQESGLTDSMIRRWRRQYEAK